jgi:large subunit ribosomal protein L22
MKFVAKAKFLRFSPYKLRPLADVIRGKNVRFALNWLSTCAVQKAEPIYKVLASAAANAKQLGNFEADQLTISEIRVDQGPINRYFKPSAMGRSNIQRKRSCHMNIIVEPVKKEA